MIKTRSIINGLNARYLVTGGFAAFSLFTVILMIIKTLL